MDSTLCVCPIDGDLLAEGYLESWDGKIRYIHGLAEVAALANRLHARLFWDLPEAITRDAVAVCTWRHGRIYLKPWLFHSSPHFVRRILEHELAHCWLGYPEVNVENWAAIIQGGKDYDGSAVEMWEA